MIHKLSVGTVMILLATAQFGVGCANGENFSGQGNSSQSTPGAPGAPAQNNSVPACEINMPQLEIEANVNSFEFQDSFGFTFGFNQNGMDPGAPGGSASVQISTASMSLSMEGINPLNSGILVSDTVSSNQTSTNLNATVDFSGMSGGGNWYSSTALSTVSAKGLALGVQGIKSQYDSVTWEGSVIQILGAEVMINGGSVTGILVGDTFSVYNTQYIWENMAAPCAAGNTYFGSQHVPTTPIATLTIVQTDPSSNVAFATFVMAQGAGEYALSQGDQVVPLKLGGTNRYLKKNVILGTVAAQTFSVPGGGSFDFGTAVNGQLANAVISNGFVVMP